MGIKQQLTNNGWWTFVQLSNFIKDLLCTEDKALHITSPLKIK